MKINNPLSDVFIEDSFAIRTKSNDQLTVCRGLRLTGIALDNTSHLHCSNVEQVLCGLFQALPPEFTLQVHCANSGDYSLELLSYYNDSQVNPGWSQQQRNARYVMIEEQSQAGLLSRKEIHLFLSREVVRDKKSKLNSESLEALLKFEAKGFDLAVEQIKHAFQLAGGQAHLLNNDELFVHFDRALNPSQSPYQARTTRDSFRPDESVSENCLHSDMVPIQENEVGFHYDGLYHAILVLENLPSHTTSGGVVQLSHLPLKDYSLTVTGKPLDLETEISLQEKQNKRLRCTLATSDQDRLRMPLQKGEERLNRLSHGEVLPYRIQFTIHCWDVDAGNLQNKIALLKSAILRFQHAQYYCVSNPVFARNLWLTTMPCFAFEEEAFIHDTEDVTLAHILPISGGNDASLTKAEAIYQTQQGGIFGISLFRDALGKPFVRHGICTGKSGTGKSATSIDLATQIAAHVSRTFIVEDGGSWMGYVSTFGDRANSLIIDKNGNSTLNYFDTYGLPVSAQSLSDSVAFLKLMIEKEERHRVSKSYILTLVRSFLNNHAKTWARNNPIKFRRAKDEFRVARRHLSQAPDRNPNNLVSNQYSDFVDWKETSPSSYQDAKIQAKQEDEQIKAEDFYRFLFAYMTKEEMPTHSQFHDWLKESLPTPETQNAEERTLLNALASWRADSGENGCLFDGISTFGFDAPIVHIELGRIGTEDKALKEMASFLITGAIRNTITRMDRSLTKLVIFEELGRFLTFEHADEIVSDYYERGRKYNTSVLCIIQQITKIPGALRNSILSNSSLALLFRQEDTTNADELQRAFKLPESTKQALSTLPRPSQATGASFICWQSGDEAPVIHSGRNVVSREMLYITASEGDAHEQRIKALRNYDDVINGIQIEANKSS